MRRISLIPQVHFCPQLRAVLLAPGPDQLRLHQDRTRESIYKRPKVVLSVLCLSLSPLYEEKKGLHIMLDRNNVGCEKLLPVHVPSTQPNGLQSRQPGHKRNANRKLVHETHIISVKYGSLSLRFFALSLPFFN